MAHRVEIREVYRTYAPPAWVRPTVERILDQIPDKFITGLKTVVLTEASGLSRHRRRAKTTSRRKKVRIREAWGLYHQKSKGEPAWIELFVDNIVHWHGGMLRVQFIRDYVIGEVLLHEVGHHIHATKAPEYKEKEDVADEWKARMLRLYLLKRYWYFLPLARGLVRFSKWIRSIIGSG